jgi:hypothetical protein
VVTIILSLVSPIRQGFRIKRVYDAMWQAMKPGNYLQIDETPVKRKFTSGLNA